MPSLSQSSPQRSSRPQHWEAEFEKGMPSSGWGLTQVSQENSAQRRPWDLAGCIQCRSLARGTFERSRTGPQELKKARRQILHLSSDRRSRNLLKFNKKKSLVLHLGRNTQYRLGLSGKQASGKSWCVWSWVWASSVHWQQRPAVSSAVWAGLQPAERRDDCPALYSSDHIQNTTTPTHKYKKHINELRQISAGGFKTVWGVEHQTCGERLKEQGMFCLKNRWLWGHLPTVP